MTLTRRFLIVAVIGAVLPAADARAQDLLVGAYAPAPVKVNIATIAAAYNTGGVMFDPTLPITDAHATFGVVALGYTRSMNVAGRFASAGVLVPIWNGHIEGLLLGQFESRTRKGPGDLSARFAINLVGARAMAPKQFVTYRQTTILGVSFTVSAPTGQYDSTRIINLGTNRWALKSEVGFSRRRGKWTVEVDGGFTFFTTNTNYYNGGTRAQAPIESIQAHLMYTIRPGFWIAADGNFWHGGLLTTNGIEATLKQSNSRVGFTTAVPIGRRQIRIACAFGAYTRVGGDFSTIGISYSHAWMGHP